MAASTAVIEPNLGLYLDRAPIALSSQMLQGGLNFTIREGILNNLNLGWTRFGDFILNGPVVLIDNFFVRGLSEQLIFGTPSDLYLYDPTGAGSVRFLSPRYEEGTASASGTAVTGVGSSWDNLVKPGDQVHFGASGYTDPGGLWYTVDTVTDDTTFSILTSAGTVVNGPYTIRRRFTGSVTDIWVTDKFLNATPANEDQWFGTNGIEPVVRWNGVDDQVEFLDCLGFTCKTLHVYDNMMIYGNLTQDGTLKPTDMINSDVGSPANVAGGLSEQFRVHSGQDGILAFEKIADNLVAYSSNTVTLIQFVGDPTVFAFRDIVIGKGPIGPRAIARFGDYHEFIGRDSQYKFDGAAITKTGLQVWREVLRTQDPKRAPIAYSHFDEENGDLLWVVPSTTDPGAGDETAPPTKAYNEHYLENVGSSSPLAHSVPTPFSVRSFPFTSAGYCTRAEGLTWDQMVDEWHTYNFRWNDRFSFASFPLNLSGDNTGKVFSFNTAQDADGAALPSYVKFGRRALGDGRMRGLISRIYPFVLQFDSPLKVTVHLADHAGGPATINAVFQFDQELPQGGHFVSVFRRGRYSEIEFGTDGPGAPWQLQGYDIDIKRGGMR